MSATAKRKPVLREVLVECRGVPVLMINEGRGWSANAIQLGYFPISSTGYRSMTTRWGGDTAAPDPVPGPAELEAAAVENEKDVAATLRRCNAFKAPSPGASEEARHGAAISARGTLETAIDRAAHARPGMQRDLIRGAARVAALGAKLGTFTGTRSYGMGGWTPERQNEIVTKLQAYAKPLAELAALVPAAPPQAWAAIVAVSASGERSGLWLPPIMRAWIAGEHEDPAPIDRVPTARVEKSGQLAFDL